MAAKKEIKKLERTYVIPLRREFQKVPIWRKTEKAIVAVKEFLIKHMKSEDVKISKEVNEYLWRHGIKNPPHKVKVNVEKDETGKVTAYLFGAKKEESKKEEKKNAKKTESKKEAHSSQKDAE